MACLNDLIFSLVWCVSVSWYVRIIKTNAEIQSSQANIVYHVSGSIFSTNELIIGVIIAANSQ